jgi:DNA-binding HxlR family transcriptional regulator
VESILRNINKLFENRVRLGIMSVLTVEDNTDFNRLKEILQVTDGNLSTHLRTLEKHEYIEVQKRFVGRKPQSKYSATEKGRKAFKDHLDALERIIQKRKQ